MSADRLERDAERAADRLRVVGPRMAARTGPQAQALLDAVRADLQRLADLAADAEGRPRRAVPVLAAHALADQVLVLAHDVAVAAPGTPGERPRPTPPSPSSRSCAPGSERPAARRVRARPACDDHAMSKQLLVGIGLLLVLMGAIWTGQGLGFIGGSFMTGEVLWAVIGPITALAGAALAYRGSRRA